MREGERIEGGRERERESEKEREGRRRWRERMGRERKILILKSASLKVNFFK